VPSSSKNNYQGTCALISQKRIRGHKKIFFRGILSGESFSREKKSEAAVAVVAKFFGGGPEKSVVGQSDLLSLELCKRVRGIFFFRYVRDNPKP
jgi:hypothetical protein